MYVQEKYYKILESTKYDDIETIKRNYKQIIFYNHPDRGGDENFAKEVNMAWEIIKKYHIQQKRQSTNQKTNNDTKHANTNNKTRKTTNKHKNSSKKHKTKTKKSYSKNKRRCSKCGSEYEQSDVYCTQCGHKIHHKTNTSHNNEDAELICIGVVLIAIGLVLLSVFWPIGIIYFYILYKYITG